MASFAGLVLRASQAMGAPLHLANHLGVDPADVYRWIAGIELPKAIYQEHFQQRLLRVLDDQRPDPGQVERAAAKWMRRWGDSAPALV